MSIGAVNSSDINDRFKKRISGAAAAGVVAGSAGLSMKKNWLFKGMPSDAFIKTTEKNLEQTMTSDELKEASRINKFMRDVVDPEVDIETLKPQIRSSKELSAAIKSSPDENIETAINRVFSKPDKGQIKQELLDLQFKTVSDKKADRNTALKLIYDNFDAKDKKLVQSKDTPPKMFKAVKNAAKSVQRKAVAAGGIVTGLAAAALCLVAYEVPGENE